jgi:pilus assembly protein CpaD
MTSAHLASRHRAAGLLTVLGCAGMLAACTTTNEVTGSLPDDYKLRHPIVIKEGVRTVELFIGAKRGSLNETQRAQVLAFAHQWRKEATGGILIDLPAGTSNEAAAAGALPEVRSILAATGVPPDAIQVAPYHPNDPLKFATLRLKYPRVAAQAGPCGLWPYDLGPTYDREHYENREYYNLGCANQRNLAAMVDNPEDLVQPRGETPSYTGRRTTVLDQYHRGQDPSTISQKADQGKISDLGK